LLDPSHTGIDLDAGGAPITWDVNADGELLLSFPDRDVRIIPLRDEAPSVSQVVALVHFDDGTRAIAHRFALHGTDVPWWDAAPDILGTYQQNAGRVSGDNVFRIELRPDNLAPSFQTYFAGEFAGQEFQLATMYWSFLGGQRSVELRRCVGTDDNGDPIERIIIDRNPAFGECDQFYRYRKLSLYTSNGNDLYFREDNMDWYSDPTVGDPPWYQHSRPILYRFSPPGPVLP
jgi:hypothetical protein